MNRLIPIATLLSALSLVACEKPTVVKVPAPSATVPGPTGPQGATGKTGDSATLIVVPPAASAPAN
jgi:hypothetical protein